MILKLTTKKPFLTFIFSGPYFICVCNKMYHKYKRNPGYIYTVMESERTLSGNLVDQWPMKPYALFIHEKWLADFFHNETIY